jgi:tRNA isopentenyl-2-thiomethyl-A-37 hydroxylase MiaE
MELIGSERIHYKDRLRFKCAYNGHDAAAKLHNGRAGTIGIVEEKLLRHTERTPGIHSFLPAHLHELQG